MNYLKTLYKENVLYTLFTFVFLFFLICSYLFGHAQGFETPSTLLFVIGVTICLTPAFTYVTLKLASLTIVSTTRNTYIDFLYRHNLFYCIAIFLMQLPVFLAFYPGICYYDIDVQVAQFESAQFITNHPLLHTLFIGFFKNLFETPNTGYALSTLIQMIIVDCTMAYALSYLYKKTENVILCTISAIFYGLFPVNSLLTISTTKDILFAAFALVFFIDVLRNLHKNQLKKISYIRIVLNAILMMLFRNNAIFAFLPTFCIITAIKLYKKEKSKIILLICLGISLLYPVTDNFLTSSLGAVNGSIKEMLSIPAQELARIYNTTENTTDKELILSYIAEPENYNYYLSDAIKQQLPFEILDSKCKHFLLDSAIFHFKYPITCLDAILYNTQGYWDLFHSPYQSDHYFLSTTNYRGGSVLDSKIPALANLYVKLFHVTEKYQHNAFAILFLNSGIYIWIMLFTFIKSIHDKKTYLSLSLLFPVFYLFTLCLGPGAIIRYTFVYLLIAPVVIGIGFSHESV